jgi:hypothetical protein
MPGGNGTLFSIEDLDDREPDALGILAAAYVAEFYGQGKEPDRAVVGLDGTLEGLVRAAWQRQRR